MENRTFEKKLSVSLVFFIILLLTWSHVIHAACYRKPQGATGDRSPVDENYQIQIDGNPASYIPGQQYNISLSSANGLKFISFTLLLEADSPTSAAASSSGDGDQILGHFEIIDNAETKFSTLCENMIESSNTNAKNRIDVAWIAPSDPKSGCVLFKAAILQHRDVWFVDDGFLTKRLCPEEIDEVNNQTPPVNPCCACDEAKYEIVLERKWRRNTHAKDFPAEAWRTKLGDVIGASHSLDFRFWEYGGLASQGLKELAEHGATKTLENEIKKQIGAGHIRTIIKAPGIKYHPNILGKTLATVRVGPNHHVISLVQKIEPSPDWILGVSGLELCLANCTWIEKKVLNLYPWDIGTDAGPSYMSPDQAQHPPDVIRRIGATLDYRSPFFEKDDTVMKPLATLHVTRKRTYDRECDFEETNALECSTHPWSSWTECSTKCGAGTQYRFRSYKDPKVAESFGCNIVLRQKENCVGTQCGLQQAALPSAECELNNWSTWSECSKKCGKGFQTRTRDYNNPYAKEKCQAGVAVELQQTRSCNGENCGGNIFSSSFDTNNNDMFEQNFGKQEIEENPFKNTEFERKPFGNGQQYPELSPNPFDRTDNNEFENVKNIYGNEELVGSRPQRPYERNEYENMKNIYGNENLVGSRTRRPYEHNEYENMQNIYGNEKLVGSRPQRPYERNEYENVKNIYGNENLVGSRTRRPYEHDRNKTIWDPYGFKTIESENVNQQEENFCLEKPVASSKRCNKKRMIVKNYWFYDADDDECKLFTADNCDENKNKFLSMEKCNETCFWTIMRYKQNGMTMNGRGFEITQQPSVLTGWN